MKKRVIFKAPLSRLVISKFHFLGQIWSKRAIFQGAKGKNAFFIFFSFEGQSQGTLAHEIRGSKGPTYVSLKPIKHPYEVPLI